MRFAKPFKIAQALVNGDSIYIRCRAEEDLKIDAAAAVGGNIHNQLEGGRRVREVESVSADSLKKEQRGEVEFELMQVDKKLK